MLKEEQDMKQEEVVEAEFEEVQEEQANEPAPQEEQAEENQISVTKGLTIFHTENGEFGWTPIKDISLEDLSFYHDYLGEILKRQWDQRLDAKGDSADA